MKHEEVKENLREKLIAAPEGITGVEFLGIEELNDTAYFVRVRLQFADGTAPMEIPVVYYPEDCLFTPMDWQGYLPVEPSEIERIDWQFDTTGIKAVMFCGLPRMQLFM